MSTPRAYLWSKLSDEENEFRVGRDRLFPRTSTKSESRNAGRPSQRCCDPAHAPENECNDNAGGFSATAPSSLLCRRCSSLAPALEWNSSCAFFLLSMGRLKPRQASNVARLPTNTAFVPENHFREREKSSRKDDTCFSRERPPFRVRPFATFLLSM